MPKAYHRISDLDEPILHGKALGFSIEEIAAALGVSAEVVSSCFEAHMQPKPKPLPLVSNRPHKQVFTRSERESQQINDPRYAAWLRARNGAHQTRKGIAQ